MKCSKMFKCSIYVGPGFRYSNDNEMIMVLVMYGLFQIIVMIVVMIMDVY